MRKVLYRLAEGEDHLVRRPTLADLTVHTQLNGERVDRVGLLVVHDNPGTGTRSRVEVLLQCPRHGPSVVGWSHAQRRVTQAEVVPCRITPHRHVTCRNR